MGLFIFGYVLGWVMPTERQNTKEIEGAGESAFK